MFKLFGKGAKSECFSTDHRFICRSTIGERTRKFRNLSNPTTVFLKLAFNVEVHGHHLDQSDRLVYSRRIPDAQRSR